MLVDSYTCPVVSTQVSNEEYDAFFKQTFKEFLEPLAHSHFNVEGTIEFTAMLFVPGMAPFEQQVHTLAPRIRCTWLKLSYSYGQGLWF